MVLKHNSDILSKLVLEDGSVLRASTNAVPTLDCLWRDPQQDGGGLLQVWAINPLPGKPEEPPRCHAVVPGMKSCLGVRPRSPPFPRCIIAPMPIPYQHHRRVTLAGTGVVGSFNIQGASFSQSERTWVRHRGDGHDGASPGVKGTVSPSDVHPFRLASHGTPPPAPAAGETGQSDGGDETPQDERPPPDSFAVYLHCRREARVVGLHEAVEIEVLPLCYELATFSRVVLLPLSPSPPGALPGPGPGGISEGERPAAAVGAGADGQGQGGAARDRDRHVRWAVLGLSNMFNSSAAVTSQEVTTCASIVSRRAASPSEEEGDVAPSIGESDSSSGGNGSSPEGRSGGAKAGVSLTVRGSGKFLAVASKKPALVRLFRGAGEGEASGRDGEGGDDAGVLEVSFSALSGDDSATASEGGTRMGLVGVELPGPWDGRERRLVFGWDTS